MEKRPDLIETLIQMLLEINSGSDGLQLPFIFTTFTTKDLIPITLRQKIEQAGVGIFCKFAPQHLILRHSATAWFLVSLKVLWPEEYKAKPFFSLFFRHTVEAAACTNQSTMPYRLFSGQ